MLSTSLSNITGEKADQMLGHHETTLDPLYYQFFGPWLNKNRNSDAKACLSLLTSSTSITYLCHESATIRLANPEGPGWTEFTVFGSPYSPTDRFAQAFSYHRLESDYPWRPIGADPALSHWGALDSKLMTAKDVWASIPTNTDILITHTPPSGHLDYCSLRGGNIGCKELLKTLGRVRPVLHVCGHAYDGRGSDRIQWDISESGSSATVSKVESWEDNSPDPRSAKISRVDLTGRRGNRPIDWHDSRNRHHKDLDGPRTQQSARDDTTATATATGSSSSSSSNRESGPGNDGVTASPEQPLSAVRPDPMGRRETCVVNCAIMASYWPHRHRKFNKPIVVDLDLPIVQT